MSRSDEIIARVIEAQGRPFSKEDEEVVASASAGCGYSEESIKEAAMALFSAYQKEPILSEKEFLDVLKKLIKKLFYAGPPAENSYRLFFLVAAMMHYRDDHNLSVIDLTIERGHFSAAFFLIETVFKFFYAGKKINLDLINFMEKDGGGILSKSLMLLKWSYDARSPYVDKDGSMVVSQPLLAINNFLDQFFSEELPDLNKQNFLKEALKSLKLFPALPEYAENIKQYTKVLRALALLKFNVDSSELKKYFEEVLDYQDSSVLINSIEDTKPSPISENVPGKNQKELINSIKEIFDKKDVEALKKFVANA